MCFLYHLQFKIKNIISSKSERSRLIKKNIAGSFLLKIINISISLLLVPMTIGYVSSKLYGIWITLSSIISWISFFDIGFGNGLKNKVTEFLAKNDYKTARKYIATTYMFLFVIFSFVGILLYNIIPLIPWCSLINVDICFANDIIKVLRIITIFFCITMVLKIQCTVLNALQRIATSNLFDTIGQLSVLISTFILTLVTKPSIVYLAYIVSGMPLISLLIGTVWIYGYKYKNLKPKFSDIDKTFASNILGLGLKFFIIQIAYIVLYQTTSVIISNVSNPEYVTEYNVVYKYFSISLMAFNIIIAPFWTAFTDAYSRNDYPWMQSVYKKLLKTFLFTFLISFILFIFYPIAFHLWLGSKVTIHLSMVVIVCIYTIMNAWNGINATIINGIGKIKIQLYSSIIGTLLNIPTAFILGHLLGAQGVVLSIVIFCLIPAILLHIQTKKLLNKTASGIWNK